jgi:hypothetical protein
MNQWRRTRKNQRRDEGGEKRKRNNEMKIGKSVSIFLERVVGSTSLLQLLYQII